METRARAERALRANGLRPTPIRMDVYSLLLGTDRHPTADQVYQSLKKDSPTLSRTSVYNALHALEQRSLLQALHVGENRTHYDADCREHSHFWCTGCGQVQDVSWQTRESETPPELDGYLVRSVQTCYQGLCPACQHNEEDN